jgi:hypothetical protein
MISEDNLANDPIIHLTFMPGSTLIRTTVLFAFAAIVV